jgi:hypothetical protein
MDEQTLFANGFEDALIGVGHRHNQQVAIYDYWECVNILIRRDKMTEEDAIEHMEYNVIGSYVGEHTPIFFDKELMNGHST